VTSFIDYFKRW